MKLKEYLIVYHKFYYENFSSYEPLLFDTFVEEIGREPTEEEYAALLEKVSDHITESFIKGNPYK